MNYNNAAVAFLSGLYAGFPLVPKAHRSQWDKPTHDRVRSRYTPHQGARECARRVRQMAKGAAQ